MGQYDKSIADLNEAISLNSSNLRAFLERGVTYQNMSSACAISIMKEE
ncbi:MAG: tetratricopeptide repeat protein [Alphaproteobacteria bacterium]|nr:MAG: tetratricopeptide repeat protein [Alphaproteobacteria bacterium]TMJ43514.1 MAG: tetratricopeptide repeat protein [Alphaproteobacteria bacterium]